MLKIFGAFFTLIILFSTTAVAQISQPWERLAPPGTGFVVMLPGKPEETAASKETFTSRLFTLVAKDGTSPRAVYLAGFGEYAPTVKFDPQAELEANRDNFIKAIPGMRMLDTRRITLDGRLGLEFTGESAQYHVTSRVYVAGNRVFQLAVMVFKGIDERANINKYFDSFAFLTD